jgi:FkbM family methyltransferase
MKAAIKRTLLSGPVRRAITGSELGLELLRLVRPYGHHHFFPLLRQLGFAPRHVVDVGANRGFWTRVAFKYFRDPVYTLVEPQDHLRSYCQDLVAQGCKLKWVNAGCGDFCGTLPLIVSHRDDSSTFVDRHHNPTTQRITVPMITLNQLVASSDAVLPEMVKIDAEGFDLKVLAGASDLLGKTDIFLVEAAVWGVGAGRAATTSAISPYRTAGPGILPSSAFDNSVAEVVSFMAKAGYNLMDITDLNRGPKNGVLGLCELAFLRDGSPLLNAVSSNE